MRLIDLFVCAPAAVVAVRSLRLPRSGAALIGPVAPELELLVQEGAGPERHVALSGTTSVGAAPTCGLRARAPGLARCHATIERQESSWVVVDSGSSTGIWVNESPVFGPAPLAPGDVIRMGALTIQVERISGSAGRTR